MSDPVTVGQVSNRLGFAVQAVAAGFAGESRLDVAAVARDVAADCDVVAVRRTIAVLELAVAEWAAAAAARISG